MNFEILGEIIQIETIAGGTAIRDLPRLRRLKGRVGGASSRGKRGCGSAAAVFVRLFYGAPTSRRSQGVFDKRDRSNLLFEPLRHPPFSFLLRNHCTSALGV